MIVNLKSKMINSTYLSLELKNSITNEIIFYGEINNIFKDINYNNYLNNKDSKQLLDNLYFTNQLKDFKNYKINSLKNKIVNNYFVGDFNFIKEKLNDCINKLNITNIACEDTDDYNLISNYLFINDKELSNDELTFKRLLEIFNIDNKKVGLNDYLNE